jgi:hypothetical protein
MNNRPSIRGRKQKAFIAITDSIFNTQFMKSLPIICTMLFQLTLATVTQAAGQFPAPAFLPTPPLITKELRDYSAADVFSVICRVDSLPEDHPFRNQKLWAEGYIAQNWPGAKVPENLDAVMKFICDADKASSGMVADNVEWFMTRAMDITDEMKVQAIIRVREAQTEETKKRLIENFGKRMFFVIYDPQLLFWSQTELDDVTLLPTGPQRVEGLHDAPITKRQAALNERINYLKIIGQITDKSPFIGPDEAVNCQNMKNLIETKWNEIVQKCAQRKSDPARRLRNVSLHTWGAPEVP